VRNVRRGERYISSSLSKDAVNWAALERGTHFNRERDITVRQREVVQLLAERRRPKEIACLLKVSPRTVFFHKYRVMQRLGIKSEAELIRHAPGQDLVQPMNPV
jgi:DNA-binding CsgD family transcriptional regulator